MAVIKRRWRAIFTKSSGKNPPKSSGDSTNHDADANGQLPSPPPASPDTLSTSVTVQEAWHLAVDEYTRDLSEEEKKTFQTATLESLLFQFEVTEKLHRSTSTTRKWVTRFHPLIKTLQNMSAALSVFAQVKPMPMCLIWGSMLLVLQVVGNVEATFEHIVEIFERINDNLPRFESYAELFPRSSLLQKAVANIYVDIIRFCMDGRRLFLKEGKARDRMWRPWSSHFERTLANLKKHRTLVEDSARVSFIEEAKVEWETSRQERLLNDTERQEAKHGRKVAQQGLLKADMHYATSSKFYEESSRQNQATKYREISRWLCPTSIVASFYNIKSRRVDGTGEWITQHPQFKTFASNPDTVSGRLLWIHGKAGSGKSVLATRIIDHLTAPVDDLPQRDLILYYFCNATDPKKRKPVQVVGGLLSQIIGHKRDLLPLVEPLYDPELTIPENIDTLWTCVTKAIEKESSKVRIILDGLDECENNSELTRVLCSAVASLSQLSVIVLSRPEEPIREQLQQATSISLTSENVSADLNLYTETAVRTRILIESESTKQKIVDVLTQKAQGMFLWVKLMVDMLASQTTFNEIDSYLEEISPELDKAYTSALRYISYEHTTRRQAAAKILKWVACAGRPLTVSEIATVFSIKDGSPVLDRSAQLLAPRQFLLRVCGSFLEVHADDTIQFIHATAKDFLLSFAPVETAEKELKDFVIDSDQAHYEIAGTCLTFLSVDEFKDGYPLEKNAVRVYCEARPLLDYASRHWLQHLSSSQKPDQRLLHKIVEFFNSDSGQAWVNGPAYVLTPTMSYLLVLQAQLSDWASLFPEDTPGRSVLFDIIGRMFQTLYERSSAEHGPNHETTTYAMISLGLLRYEQGKYSEAEPLLRKATDARILQYGPGDNKTLDCVNNLGLVYCEMGRYKEAEEMHRKTLEGWSANSGADSHDAYFALNNLANVLLSQQKLDEAESAYKRSIEGQTRLLGWNHADTQRPYGNLGSVYVCQKRLDEAWEVLTKCYDTRCRILGEEDPETLHASYGQAEVLRKKGQFEEAEKKFRETYDIQKRVRGANHSETLHTLLKLGLVYKAQGRVSEATEELEKALKSWKASLFTMSSVIPDMLYKLGKLYVQQNRLGDAEGVFEEAYRKSNQAFGPEAEMTWKPKRELDKIRDAKIAESG